MTFDDFVATLVADAERADGSTAFIEALLVNARKQVEAGNGTVGMINSATVNGKTFQKKIQFTGMEVMRACNQALKVLADDDDTVSVSYADFSHLHGSHHRR